MPTRILIVGSGGREHALAWKLANEPGVNRVVVAPGSAGIATVDRVTCALDVDPLDASAMVALARREAVELAVIGPEAALAAGITDALLAAGVATFGPTRAAARIETSKSFCREIAAAAGVPTAWGAAFDEPEAALIFARGMMAGGEGIVVKLDGLAAGKGVTLCDDNDQAEAAILAAFRAPERGTATATEPGDRVRPRVVIEERLTGREASLVALTDGLSILGLPPARDHKRLGDDDRGPNTGGMGAYSPLPDLPDDAAAELFETIHRRILAELARRGTPFRGALYAGLMLTAYGPRLLECNARFGDPETEAVIPRLAIALGPLLLAAANSRLAGSSSQSAAAGTLLPTIAGATVAVVLASAGYPAAPRRDDRIDGLEAAGEHGLVFHAGTRRDPDGTWRTNGGRVLVVVGSGSDLATARAAAGRAADAITFDGAQRRHDIGAETRHGGTGGAGVSASPTPRLAIAGGSR